MFRWVTQLTEDSKDVLGGLRVLLGSFGTVSGLNLWA